MFTIYRKELADHFSSVRFLILFCLIFMVAMVTTFMAGGNLQTALEGIENRKLTYPFLMLFTTSGPDQYFSLTEFIAFFGPLLGIIMGFDAINRERTSGTLSKVVSQPIFRDAVINGKFLAGVTTISIVLVSLLLMISGLGLIYVGVVPALDEVARLLVYLVVSIAYISFWLGLSILFSILFRSIATSALAAVSLWIFFSFFISFAADLVANAAAPVENPRDPDPEQLVAHARASHTVSMASPYILYSQATMNILDPFSRTASPVLVGRMESASMARFQNPLPLDQSILIVASYLTLLVGLTVLCFGVSYVTFMRQEIRSL